MYCSIGSVPSDNTAGPNQPISDLSGVVPMTGDPRLERAENLVERLTLVHNHDGTADAPGSPSSPVQGWSPGPAALRHRKRSESHPTSGSKALDVERIRLEKRRARNRASQRNTRHKLREEQSTLQLNVERLQRQLSHAQSARASLQQLRVAARKRLTTAMSALLSAGCADGTSQDRRPAASPAARPAATAAAAAPSMQSAQTSPAAPCDRMHVRGSENQSEVAVRGSQPPRTQDAALPARIDSFAHHAGITHKEIVQASRAAANSANGQCVRMRKVLEECRFRKAWAVGCLPAEVCWFVQTPYDVAPGVPLSYSTTLSSPECVASMAMHFLVSCLEFSLFMAMEGHQGTVSEPQLTAQKTSTAAPSAPHIAPAHTSPPPDITRRPAAPQQATQHSTQHALHPPQTKAAKHNTLPPLHGSPRSWHRPKPTAFSPQPGACPPHDAAPANSHQTHACCGQGAAAAPSGTGPAPSGRTHEAAEKPPAGEHWSGFVRCGVNETCAAQAALRAVVRSVQRSFHGHVSAEELKWAFDQTASHLDDLLFATFAPVVTEGGGCVSGHPRAADTEASRYHGAVTEAMAYLLPGLHTQLLKLPDSTGAENEAAAEQHNPQTTGASAALRQQNYHQQQQGSQGQRVTQRVTAAAELRRHASAIMTMYSSGHVLVLADASRIVRTLSVNGTKAMIQQFEVENMHVRVYRSLRLTAAQRSAMRDVWLEWEQNRRRVDAPVATARDCLASLPTCIPLSPSFAQRVFDIANGTLPPSELARAAPSVLEHASGPAPWEREAVVPLLGAAQEFSVLAAEALRLLWYAQEAESSVTNHLTCQRLQPGRVLDLQQQMRLYSSHLLFIGAPYVDFLALCQHALTQQRRESLFRVRGDPYGSGGGR